MRLGSDEFFFGCLYCIDLFSGVAYGVCVEKREYSTYIFCELMDQFECGDSSPVKYKADRIVWFV